ncbi:MerR family transcriptional regulator [Magnetofaba australis]|uniref:Putative MerR family transcriptional regulator n=1 Tax=Magnetofaba australis IT-1 TaxID=1434232 RepID=A0A1Y2K3R9_9PROT|nr:MerR family transcriptional regulator [Magnetofaba australis]OSM02276.1 putative MerR family transcriptional regulator [Magnetofaba australis IT-1]
MADASSRPPRRYKIGDVAKMLGVTARTLRFYQEQGLIEPQRSAGGMRQFSEADLKRIRIILEFSKLGVTLKQIGELIDSRANAKTGEQASEQVFDALNRLYQELSSKRTLLDQMNEQVKLAMEQISLCHGCQEPPGERGCSVCPLLKELPAEFRSYIFDLIWES